MKTLLIVIFLFSSFVKNELIAQDQEPKKIYDVNIILNNGEYLNHYSLYELRDTSVFASSSILKEAQPIAIQQIQSFQIRKKDKMRNGLIIDIMAGTLTGFLLGKNNNCPNCVVDSREKYGLFFGLAAGALVGVIFDGTRKKISIHGDQMIYENQKNILQQYLVK